MQPSRYRYAKLQYRFAGTSGSPSIFVSISTDSGFPQIDINIQLIKFVFEKPPYMKVTKHIEMQSNLRFQLFVLITL